MRAAVLAQSVVGHRSINSDAACRSDGQVHAIPRLTSTRVRAHLNPGADGRRMRLPLWRPRCGSPQPGWGRAAGAPAVVALAEEGVLRVSVGTSCEVMDGNAMDSARSGHGAL
jgi:hypothetical protein